MTFTFDTSGTVRDVLTSYGVHGDYRWGYLSPPQQASVEAAARGFWDGLGENTQEAMAHLGHTVGFSDFTPRALVAAMAGPVALAINADGNLDLAEPS